MFVSRLPAKLLQAFQDNSNTARSIVFEGTHVIAGEAVIAKKGDWVRYSSPLENGAEYLAICIPAFTPDTVHRDA